MSHRTWTLALAGVVASACGVNTAVESQKEEVVALEVAPDLIPCVGELVGECLRVRSPGESEWRTFYSPIEGFEHEAGVLFTLELGRRAIPNPPADGSSYRYRLLRVLSRDPVGGGVPG